MAVYAAAVFLLLLMITSELDPGTQTRAEAYADDFSSTGSIDNIKICGGRTLLSTWAPYSDTILKQQSADNCLSNTFLEKAQHSLAQRCWR